MFVEDYEGRLHLKTNIFESYFFPIIVRFTTYRALCSIKEIHDEPSGPILNYRRRIVNIYQINTVK